MDSPFLRISGGVSQRTGDFSIKKIDSTAPNAEIKTWHCGKAVTRIGEDWSVVPRAGAKPVTVTLSEANQAISGAVSRASALSARISVSVCDPSGHLIAHQRMDGAAVESSQGSIGKSIAAAQEGRPSGEDLTEFHPFPRTGLVTAMGAPNIRRPGGLPIWRGGELQGAIGVSGASTNQADEDCARAGIVALNIE